MKFEPINNRNEPREMGMFRANTSEQGAMAGVTSPSFQCKRCKRHKPAAGRKQLIKGSSRYGFVCAECAG